MTMGPRLARLKRIEDLYGMVEEVRSVALRQAAAKVYEVEEAISEQWGHARASANEGRLALLKGDRQQWLLAEAQREFGRIRRQQLEEVRVQREVVTDHAREEYGASRMKKEQIKSVVEQRETELELVAGRKTQSATDDRFLSRLRWASSRIEKT
jgi:hypothetical protein